MANIRAFYIIFIVISIKLCQANLDLFDFEHVKNDLFSGNYFNITNKASAFDDQQSIESPEKCAIEINQIKNGLTENEIWAMKIVDSWGKIPSGILNGNFYEFGAFSECLNIDRYGDPYKTKYCLGHLFFNSSEISRSKSYQSKVHHVILQAVDEPKITPRMALPTPDASLGPTITFGICLPVPCSLDLLEPLINELIHEKVQNISVQLNRNSVQFQENDFELKTIDIVTIALLGTVLCLIILSTIYDILYTINNREKSQALLAFSFYTNGMKLFSYKKTKSPDMMHCVHGIRAISTQWVVLGHTYLMYLLLPIRNMADYPSFLAKYKNMFIVSAPISVDTFFVLSGLLVSINMLKHLEKTNGRINVPLLYFHRYLRLTPLLGISFLVSMSLVRFLGNGPLWPDLMDFLGSKCERNWWSTLLYVQNYANPRDICFGHSWYLSVDMQLFFISPAIVYLMYRFRRNSLYVLSFLVLCCVGATIYVHIQYDLSSFLKKEKMAKAYYPTHIRCSPWLMGVMAGYGFVEARKRSIRIPKTLNFFAWTVSLALMAGVIFTNYPLVQVDSTANSLDYGLYDALSRVAWSIALIFIIFSCVHNSGGPVNWFLSHPLWQPISRLCYSIYLLHFPCVMVVMSSMKASPYFSELIAFHAFIGNYMLTVFVAAIATLAFESPIIIIEKLIFDQKKKPETNARNEANEIQIIKIRM
ncbi:nose resistant to fluoxetine protein 6-like isoform X1 [Sitodiplosis mosellana]|uniref:nose resistant to fluoxetine protein 6-like isoform X1 n=1 Tax=Sitodiplosis mosellana TaxID=263140 RepID=UPI002443E01E|nr:nose resistant to fluoxetine protein 6-like isoform X1 [Sitodiplosis mosellana]